MFQSPRRWATGPTGGHKTAESIRLELAAAWGEMGAAWGVTPAIARVQAYLMARQVPLTEREVREALGLSHRAASLALAEAESWGIVERVPEPRRVGRRGPAGAAYLAVGDHWQWFGRVIAERKIREGDPIVAVLEAKEREAAAAAADATRRRRARRAARLAVGLPGLRPALRPSRSASCRSSSRGSSSARSACSAGSRTRPSFACSTCWAPCPTRTSSTWSTRCRACRRPPRAGDQAHVGGRSNRRALTPRDATRARFDTPDGRPGGARQPS